MPCPFFVFINLACIIYFSMQDPVFYDLTTQGECDLTYTETEETPLRG